MSGFLAGIVWICLGFQAFHYIGYPVVLVVLARIRPRPVRKASISPRISLIVSAYNEATVIGDKLTNSLGLDYPDLEIIVNTEGSTDRTTEVVETFAAKGVIGLKGRERRGKAAALGTAAELARGEILVFSDANAFYDRQAIRHLAANFADPQVGCVSGYKAVQDTGEVDHVTAAQSEGLYWRYENLIKELESEVASSAGTVGEMLAMRKQLFAPIPAGIVNDDAYLAMRTLRQGYRVIFEPKARCWEVSSANLAEDAMRRRRITAGRFQLFSDLELWPWNQPLALFMMLSHKALRLLLPLFMIGALAANILAFLLPLEAAFGMAFTLFGQVLFYGCALVGALTERTSKGWRPTRIALYLTASHLSSLVGLWRYLNGRQTVLWEKIAR